MLVVTQDILPVLRTVGLLLVDGLFVVFRLLAGVLQVLDVLLFELGEALRVGEVGLFLLQLLAPLLHRAALCHVHRQILVIFQTLTKS